MKDAVLETDSGNVVNLEELPPFLRTLLVMDGTVTKSLEAWFWEPVNVIAKHNEIENLQQKISGLQTDKGDEVLQREVDLCGQSSKTLFASAQSIVSLRYLPNDIRQSLIEGKIGIGELLRDKELETYRDIFDINYFPDFLQSSVAKNQHDNGLSGEVISRSYRIWVNGKPAIIVSEYFPIELYNRSV